MTMIKIETNVLKRMIKKITIISDTAIAVHTARTLSVTTIDPAHVAMLEIKARTLNTPGAQKKEHPMNFETLENLIKKIPDMGKPSKKTGAKDIVKIKPLKTHMKIEHPLIMFTQGYPDMGNTTQPRLPRMTMKITAMISTRQLKAFVSMASKETDAISITGNSNGKLTAEYTDTDGLIRETDLAGQKGTWVKPSKDCPRGDIRSLYSLDYLKDILSTIRSPFITIEFSIEYPLIIRFTETGVEGNFILAPRIESEDNEEKKEVGTGTKKKPRDILKEIHKMISDGRSPGEIAAVLEIEEKLVTGLIETDPNIKTTQSIIMSLAEAIDIIGAATMKKRETLERIIKLGGKLEECTTEKMKDDIRKEISALTWTLWRTQK